MPSGVLAVLALLLATFVVAGVAVAMSATDVGRGMGTAAAQAQKIAPGYWHAVQRLPTHSQARMSAITSNDPTWSAETLPTSPRFNPRPERTAKPRPATSGEPPPESPQPIL